MRGRMKNSATAAIVRMAAMKNSATIMKMATMKIQTRPDGESLIYKRAEATRAK
jgi:hypothetical protein